MLLNVTVFKQMNNDKYDNLSEQSDPPSIYSIQLHMTAAPVSLMHGRKAV